MRPPARAPRVELLCVGSELLSGQLNTHQRDLSLRLKAAGLSLAREASLPDDRGALASELRAALERSEVVLTSGGLGPTFDDLTREAAADALGRPLEFKPALWSAIRRLFSRRGLAIPESNRRQAFLLRGARALFNPFGSAPGQLLVLRRPGAAARTLVLLPGPGPELFPMFDRKVLPALRRLYGGGRHAAHLAVHLSGLPESEADERLAGLTARPDSGTEFTILASGWQVDFHATATGPSPAAAERRLAAVRRRVYAAVGDHIFGEGAASLESTVGALLRRRRLTLAVAESCTAGLVGARITAVPGSSDYLRGGVIAYSNDLKTRLLGVAPSTLARAGAVSADCAREMAAGVRRACGASVGLAVTGIAGPGGGGPGKPVGLVFVALQGPGSGPGECHRLRLSGARETVRQRAAAAALHYLHRRLKRGIEKKAGTGYPSRA